MAVSLPAWRPLRAAVILAQQERLGPLAEGSQALALALGEQAGTPPTLDRPSYGAMDKDEVKRSFLTAQSAVGTRKLGCVID